MGAIQWIWTSVSIAICFSSDHEFAYDNRRIYSFYRVANAVILSFTMIAVIWIILFEGDRHVNLIQAVTEKIGDFLRLQNSGSVSGADSYFSDAMDTARDIVIFFSLFYSAFMIISALVKLIMTRFQSKIFLILTLITGQVHLPVKVREHHHRRHRVPLSLRLLPLDCQVKDDLLNC